MNNLTDLDRQQLLIMLTGLPPEEYLAYCDTTDQKEYYKQLKIKYLILFESFNKFFTGQENNLLDELPTNLKEHFYLVRDWYLSFYTLVQGNWKNIKNEADKQKVNLFASTPGEFLIRIIENDCMAVFSYCLENYKFSPTRIVKSAQFEKNILKIFENKTSTELTKSEQIKIENYKITIQKEVKSQLNLLALRDFALKECRKSGKYTSVYRHYTDYMRVGKELDKNILGMLHPSKKVPSHQWVNGEKINCNGIS